MIERAQLEKYADELELLLQCDDDALYRQIGEAITPRGLPDWNPIELVSRGKQWLDERRSDIAEKICIRPEIRQYRSDSRARERLIAVAAVVDLLASSFGVVPPAVLLATLIREGLEALCDGYATDAN